MYADIIPIMRLPNTTDVFTYRVPPEMEGLLSIGQFIKIPWRKQKKVGVVARLHNNKPPYPRIAEISGFIEDHPSWSKAHIQSAHELASLYHCSPATVLSAYAPAFPKRKSSFEETVNSIRSIPCKEIENHNIPKSDEASALIKFARYCEKIAYLKDISSSTKNGILILTPTIIDAYELADSLKSTDSDTVVWDNNHSKNQQAQLWSYIKAKSPIVVSTRSGVFSPILNLGMIVIDQEEREDHKSWEASPHIDARESASILSKNLGIPIRYLSVCPRVNNSSTLIQGKEKLPPVHTIFHDKAKPLLHPSLQESMENVLDNLQAVCVISTHLSAARTIHCLDCHQQWKCQQCGMNLQIKQERLVCSRCKQNQPIPNRCSKCHGQRIKEFGYGVEGLAKAFSQLFQVPVETITALNADSLDISGGKLYVMSPNLVQKVAHKNPNIPIGMTLLMHPESILFIPDYRADEWFYSFISRHRQLVRDYFNCELTIQTKLSESDQLLSTVLNDNYRDFRQKEFRLRKTLQLPPFSRFIQVSLKNEGPEFYDLVRKTDRFLKGDEIIPFEVTGPEYLPSESSPKSCAWVIRQTDTRKLNLDKLDKSIYSKLVVNVNPRERF
jgi:primosomal protein N'